jgi:DNA-binding transcriptional regulator YdaS (Cro superfamily)
MEKLLAYLNGLSPDEQKAFAARCLTTVGYLRKAASVKQRLGDVLCLRIAVESGGFIKPEELAPNVDWDYLRNAIAQSPTTPCIAPADAAAQGA